MLAIKPNCEHCGKLLPNESTEAMICSFECTFCETCVNEILQNVCPNCGGNFVHRPIRPNKSLQKYPAQTQIYTKSIDWETYKTLQDYMKNIEPNKR